MSASGRKPQATRRTISSSLVSLQEEIMLLVVAYDVSDDRRRARLHTLLLGYGVAVQESLFECTVTDRQALELKQRVRTITRVRNEIDAVRYYALCADCSERIENGAGKQVECTTTVAIV